MYENELLTLRMQENLCHWTTQDGEFKALSADHTRRIIYHIPQTMVGWWRRTWAKVNFVSEGSVLDKVWEPLALIYSWFMNKRNSSFEVRSMWKFKQTSHDCGKFFKFVSISGFSSVSKSCRFHESKQHWQWNVNYLPIQRFRAANETIHVRTQINISGWVNTAANYCKYFYIIC